MPANYRTHHVYLEGKKLDKHIWKNVLNRMPMKYILKGISFENGW